MNELKKLINNDKEFVFTREPGGNGIKINEDIRLILLDPKNTNMSHKTEALLYAASRAQHVEELISPSLDKGINVVCDRYIDSSIVYQGHCRGLGEK
jgi:dTMP kinase